MDAHALGRRVGRSLRLAVIALAVVALLSPIALWRAMKPTVGRNVPRDGCPIRHLPQSAEHVSYVEAGAFGPVTVYEFDSPVADVIRWAADRGVMLAPITGDPKKVQAMGHASSDPAELDTAEVRRGLFGERIDAASPDRRTTIAYDADRGRAFVEESFR